MSPGQRRRPDGRAGFQDDWLQTAREEMRGGGETHRTGADHRDGVRAGRRKGAVPIVGRAARGQRTIGHEERFIMGEDA